MISEKDKLTLQGLAKKYRATRVLLFGSVTRENEEYNDIDIAVEGIADKDFFAFYGELMLALSKPVDVIDLSRRSRFNDLIISEGIPLDA